VWHSGQLQHALCCRATSSMPAAEQRSGLAACLPEGQQVVLIIQGHRLCSKGRVRQAEQGHGWQSMQPVRMPGSSLPNIVTRGALPAMPGLRECLLAASSFAECGSHCMWPPTISPPTVGEASVYVVHARVLAQALQGLACRCRRSGSTGTLSIITIR
jgi:hypothetical protein